MCVMLVNDSTICPAVSGLTATSRSQHHTLAAGLSNVMTFTEQLEAEKITVAKVQEWAIHDWENMPHVDFSKLTSDQMRLILKDCAANAALRAMRANWSPQ